jgi:hypothetical protein
MIGSFRGGAICTAHHVHERPPRIRHPARRPSEDDAKQLWLLTAPARVVVAADDDLIVGTANWAV